jgi:hypothetical protein
MVYSELIVWTIALSLNIYFFAYHSAFYNSTIITRAIHQIFSHPYPDWIIIILSAGSTFLSLYFGDELLDVVFHKNRKKYFKYNKWYRFIVVIFVVFLLVFLYRNFLHLFNIEI